MGIYFCCAQWDNSRFGRADNGDFSRSMGSYVTRPHKLRENLPSSVDRKKQAEAEHRERYFNFYLPRWEIQRNRRVTSEFIHGVHLLWWPGFWLNRQIFSKKILDLGYLGLFPRLLLGAAWLGVVWLLYWRRAPLAAALLLVACLALIFSDIGYVSFCNSFYQETGALVFLALLVPGLLLLAEGFYRPSCLMITPVLLLYCTAKPQYLATAVFLGVALGAVYNLGWFWEGPLPGRRLRAGLTVLSLLALAGAGVWVVGRMPAWNMRIAVSHRYYAGVLAVSRDPAAHLARKGLPASAVKYVGAFKSPEDAGSLRDLLDVIWHEPAVPFRMIARAAGLMQDVRLDYLGMAPIDFPASAHSPGGFGAWSAVKRMVFPRGTAYLVWLGAALALSVGLCCARARRMRRLGAVLLLLNAGSIIELMAALGDGFWECPKHLYAANLFFDLSLALALFVAAQLWPGRGQGEAAGMACQTRPE